LTTTSRISHASNNQSPIFLTLLVILSVIAGIFYLRLLFNPQYRGQIIPYVLVVVSEVYIVSQVLMACWTILSGNHDPKDSNYYKTRHKIFSASGNSLYEPGNIRKGLETKIPFYIEGAPVKVDVFITVFGEDLKVIEQTADAARDMVGVHATFILDDGGSDEVLKLAQQLGVTYIRREGSEGAKAGNINHALQQSTADFIVIFDADHAPKPLFLYTTMPYFQDEAVAFVQTPQSYHNKVNHISRGASYAQDLFYRYICPGKNKFNSAFCVGTNVVFRRVALDEIGGIYEQSKSEDIWTSLKLHEQGWKSVFEPEVLSSGDAPETIGAYIKQQQRWATGGMEIFFHSNPLKNRKLTFNQRLQYLWTSAFYLHGVATALLFVLPALYIVFNLSPINNNLQFSHWILLYGGFYGLQIALASYCMKGFRTETLILSTVIFPVYLRALINGLFKKDVRWNVTGQAVNTDSPFNYIVPQMLLFVFLLLVDMIAITNFYQTASFSVALLWNFINTYVFGYFIYLAYRENRYYQPGKVLS
jgi:cellulose synthase (UDP-forming)